MTQSNTPAKAAPKAAPAGLLSVEHLTKEFPAPDRPLRVLDSVSFTLNAGASLAVMGPSGSGKSTLLHIVGTLDTPTAGSVHFDGLDIHALPPARAAEFRNTQIGFVFQDHHLLPQCTALENVLLPCLARGAGQTARLDAAELLAQVGLGYKVHHFPSELSGGERQRVAVARALINHPRLLLCDEPTGNLDSVNAQSIGRLFLDLRAKAHLALIVVTHNLAFAETFGRVLVLQDGKLQ